MQEQRKEKALWESYWRERHESLQNPQGKRRAVIAAFRLLKELANGSGQPFRILELGCGEGHILGELLKLCAANKIPIQECVGIDRQPSAIETASRLYSDLCFLEDDYASHRLNLEPFDLVMLVGTLHEVYSSNYSVELGEIDDSRGKESVGKALRHAASLTRRNGYLLLFDGIEHSSAPDLKIMLRFQSTRAFAEFKKFAREYEAFRILYEEVPPGARIRIPVHDFTRYITKTRFIRDNLWEIEKRESYQYFNQDEFTNSLHELGFIIVKLRCASPHLKDWQDRVRIETPGVDFPNENILVVGQKERAHIHQDVRA